MGRTRGRGRTEFCLQTICLQENVCIKSVTQFLDFKPKKSNSRPQCNVTMIKD